MPVRSLVRDKPWQVRSHLLGKAGNAGLSVLYRLIWHDLGDDTYQGAVGPVHANRIGDHISLGNILVRNTASMRLIPVDNKLFHVTVADDVFTDLVVFPVNVLQVCVL